MKVSNRGQRSHLVPWRAAGNKSEEKITGDEVVRDTGWVFNNEVGSELTLEQFVESGNHEVALYMDRFTLNSDEPNTKAILELGCGIGRMTAAFSREYGRVVACDVDPAFLERCRQTVAQKGDVQRLRVSQVRDGHVIQEPDASVDVVFSYITLQHCSPDDAKDLVNECWRVLKPGGRMILNFRTWSKKDIVIVPAGALVRAVWRLPLIGSRLTGRRWATRLGWQANRLSVDDVLRLVPTAEGITIWKHPSRALKSIPPLQARRTDCDLEFANRSHWWLDARKPKG